MSAAGRTVAISAGVAGVVLAIMVGVGVLATRGLPPGTVVAGEPISDPTLVEPLVADLQAQLQQIPVRVIAGDASVEVAAGDLGVRLDGTGAVRTAATSTGLQPWIARMTGGPALDLPVRVLFASGMAQDLVEDLSAPPVDGAVLVTASGLQVTDAEDGREVTATDINDAFRSAISDVALLPADEWPATLEVEVDAKTTPPEIPQLAVDTVVARLQELTDGPVLLRAERVPEDAQTVDGDGVPTRESFTESIEGPALLQLLTVVAQPDRIQRERLQVMVSTDTPPPVLTSFLEQAEVAPDLDVDVVDRSPTPTKVDQGSAAPPAGQPGESQQDGGQQDEGQQDEGESGASADTSSAAGPGTGPGGPADHPSYGDVSAVTGVLKVEVREPGLIPDVDQTIVAIVDAMEDREPGEEVTVDVAGQEVTEGDPADLGIVEPVSTWTTFYTPGQSRVTNIHRIAEILDGTLIPPGGNLDINHAVGRRTAADGFVSAGAILEGEFVTDIGGGVSQFATTFFNAMWFSGVDIITHTPHSFWFDRYPAAREATIDYPGVDLELNNNTPYWILVDTAVTADSVTVTFWSTKWFEVQTTMGEREPTAEGFRMTIARRASAPDGVVDDDQFTVDYKLP